MTTIGVDVSRAQAPARCDWGRAYADGVRFAWVKGSEGAGGPGAYVDPSAAEHLERIRRTRIISGVYHFARPDNRFAASPNGYANGVLEGEHAATTAVMLGAAWAGSLPVALDLEKYTPRELGITDEQRGAFVLGMVNTVEQRLGRLPVIYTGANYWGYQMPASLAGELHERGVPLWLVNYEKASQPSASIPDWPWSVWQRSGGGDFVTRPPIDGLPHPIDQNSYRGTMAELRGLAGCCGA